MSRSPSHLFTTTLYQATIRQFTNWHIIELTNSSPAPPFPIAFLFLMRFMKYVLALVVLFSALPAWSQDRVFMGRVVDRHNKGVPFAVVQAKGRNEGVYCDENGAFAFTGNAERIKTLVVSCLGFQRKEVSTDIIPLDSVIIQLKTKVSPLKETTITPYKGKKEHGVLGRSRRHVDYTGDCYRYYGSETAIKLKADTSRHGILENVYVFITDEGDFNTKFRVHVYEWGDLPEKEITDSNLIVQASRGNSWVKVDLSDKRIRINQGLFVSVEWISGFGNNQKSLQSAKNPEVNDYNGQVLGLTADYGNPSKTYSRKPFSEEWEYYDAPDAQRKGGYFLNPMIYCTYIYYKK